MKRRDSQRNRVYRWEDKLFQFYEGDTPNGEARFLRFEECQLESMVAKLNLAFCRHRPATVQISKTETNVSRSFTDGRIVLSKHHLIVEILLHEFAHHLCDTYYTYYSLKEVEPHGPEWLTIHMILLILCLGYDKDYLIISANNAGLRFFPRMLHQTEQIWQNHKNIQLYTQGTQTAA